MIGPTASRVAAADHIVESELDSPVMPCELHIVTPRSDHDFDLNDGQSGSQARIRINRSCLSRAGKVVGKPGREASCMDQAVVIAYRPAGHLSAVSG